MTAPEPPRDQTEPDWVEHAIWWHVYPLGFVGADTAGSTRERGAGLGHLTAWLGYVVELGASGLALGPVFASETHGYDTLDFFRIDERLGTGEDFDALVEAAHDRGLRVLLDGVFNHVGRGFPAYGRVLEHGPDATEASWFRLTWPPDAGPGSTPQHETFEGHEGLVALNHAEPAITDLVVEVMCHWLERGADGWRLDAAYAVDPAFWATVLPRVRERFPQAYVVGEVLHGDYRALVHDAQLDSLTQYELWKAIWSSVHDANFFELDHALGRHNTYLESFVPMTFVGNHDVTRIADQVDDDRHLPHAVVLLLMLGGTPSIYYGDEQALRGVKEERAGGDDAVRPAFPAGPEALSPLGQATYALHQQLIGVRRRHPWLHRARSETLHLTNTALVLALTSGDRRVVVALNLGDEDLEQPAPGVDEALAGTAELIDDGSRLRVPGHGWAVLG